MTDAGRQPTDGTPTYLRSGDAAPASIEALMSLPDNHNVNGSRAKVCIRASMAC